MLEQQQINQVPFPSSLFFLYFDESIEDEAETLGSDSLVTTVPWLTCVTIFIAVKVEEIKK